MVMENDMFIVYGGARNSGKSMAVMDMIEASLKNEKAMFCLRHLVEWHFAWVYEVDYKVKGTPFETWCNRKIRNAIEMGTRRVILPRGGGRVIPIAWSITQIRDL